MEISVIRIIMLTDSVLNRVSNRADTYRKRCLKQTKMKTDLAAWFLSTCAAGINLELRILKFLMKNKQYKDHSPAVQVLINWTSLSSLAIADREILLAKGNVAKTQQLQMGNRDKNSRR